MAKFIFSQRTVDYYVVEAESEEEALDILYSGEAQVANTKYDDYNLEGTE